MKLSRLIIAFSFITMVLYFLPATGIFNLRNALWGLALNSFLPTPLIIIQLIMLFFVLAFFFVPYIELVAKIPLMAFKIFWALSFIMGCILLQDGTLLYGDSLLLVKKIEVALPKMPAEPLSVILYRAFYLIMPQTNKSGELAYRIINTLSVIPVVFCYLKLAQREDKSIQPAFLLILFSLGITGLFMGHVENYTLAYVTMLMYYVFITSSKPPIRMICLTFSLSICLHMISVLLLPSFISIVLKSRKYIKWWLVFIFLALPVLTTIILAAVIGLPLDLFFKGILDTPLQFAASRSFPSYIGSIVNFNHLLDILNILFINLPIAPVAFGFLIFRRIKKRIQKNVIARITLFMAIPFMVFILFFDSPLGLARDWDLGSLCLIWFVFFLIQEFVISLKISSRAASFLLPISLFSILLSLPWFLVNHSPTMSLERFIGILEIRPALPGTAYGYEALGRFYWDEKNFDSAAKYYRKAASSNPDNWRFWTSAGLAHLYNNEPMEALENLRIARSLFQTDPRIFAGLGSAYGMVGLRDSAMLSWEKAYQLDSTDINIQLNLALSHYYAGNYPQTVYLCIKIVDQQNLHSAYMLLFDALIADKKLSEARRTLEEAQNAFGPTQGILQRWQLFNQAESK